VSRTRLKIEKLESGRLRFDDVIIDLGEIQEAWEEEMGPTPKPGVIDLRSWDRKLLKRYEPFYSPLNEICELCTYGPCDLSQGKKGACGIDLRGQTARINVIVATIGTTAHAAHARGVLEHAIQKKGRDAPIDLGDNVLVEAPIIRTVLGIKPQTLGDLEEVLEYTDRETTKVLASTATGQEGNYLDLESKGLHISLMDNVVKEVADLAQIIGYDFPKGDPDAPLVEVGPGTIDREKPTILFIGHDVCPGAEVVDYLEKHNLDDQVQLCGICCTTHDLTRYNSRVRIVGPMTQQTKFIKSGLADVVMIDVQCVRPDVLDMAIQAQSPLIATNEEMMLGLEDRTNDPVEEIVSDLVSGKKPGAVILDTEKVGEVATKVVLGVTPLRKEMKVSPDLSWVEEQAKRCIDCRACQRVCPVHIPIFDAMKAARKGDFELLSQQEEICIGCAKCESACKPKIPIIPMLERAAEKRLKEAKYKMRSGRGPILDTEIRNVGPPIVLGEIPGVIVFAGCPNRAEGAREQAEMAEEFLKRGYIVVASGCAAMDIASYKTEDGQSLYEAYPGNFDKGGLCNVGSCVANAHILGAAVKIPNIFAKRNLRGNFEEIADYILNRVGAVAVDWGAMSQKAFAIGTGVNRWGIPLITGPQGAKFRRLYLGRKDQEEKWITYDAKTGKKLVTEPAPEHLCYVAESKEEAIVAIAKLCIRPNDTTKGRQLKLAHYVDLHERIYGTMPEDVHLFIRTEADIPITRKEEIRKVLKAKGWKEREGLDPTLIERLVKVKSP
jgi:acetyl-CoA decarbonylase/synthase complex subunit alpha